MNSSRLRAPHCPLVLGSPSTSPLRSHSISPCSPASLHTQVLTTLARARSTLSRPMYRRTLRSSFLQAPSPSRLTSGCLCLAHRLAIASSYGIPSPMSRSSLQAALAAHSRSWTCNPPRVRPMLVRRHMLFNRQVCLPEWLHRVVLRVMCFRTLRAYLRGLPCWLPRLRRWHIWHWDLPPVQRHECAVYVQLCQRRMRLQWQVHLQCRMDYLVERDGVLHMRKGILFGLERQLRE